MLFRKVCNREQHLSFLLCSSEKADDPGRGILTRERIYAEFASAEGDAAPNAPHTPLRTGPVSLAEPATWPPSALGSTL